MYKKDNGQKKTTQQIVNERILSDLDNGIIPWKQRWFSDPRGAYSHATGKPYSLLNQLILGKPGEYMTIRQCNEAGGYVRKGEKCGYLVFWKMLESKDSDENDRSIPYLKRIPVFHVSQCVGVEPRYPLPERNDSLPIEAIERLIAGYLMRTNCSLRHDESFRPEYSITLDRIYMPKMSQFDSVQDYYTSLLHEATHSTGHPSRLHRFELNEDRNKESAALEELVAELTASTIMCRLGIETADTIVNSASYIKGWANAIRADEKLFIKAASRADKAISLLLGEIEVDSSPAPLEGEVHIVPSLPEPAGQQENAIEAPEASAPLKRSAKTSMPTRKQRDGAARSFAKKCAKKTDRPSIAGAFMKNGRQYISDGFTCAVYDAPIDDIVSIDDKIPESERPDFEKAVLDKARIGALIALPNLAEMRKVYAEARQNTKGGPHHLTQLDSVFYNTEYLIRAMQLAGLSEGTGIHANGSSPRAVLYLKGDGCEVVLLPVINHTQTENIWRPIAA